LQLPERPASSEAAIRRGFTPDSFQKSTFFAAPGVAPGRRFWHGPAKFEAALYGQGWPPFYAPAAFAEKAWGSFKKI
jgi:hypothetical protein